MILANRVPLSECEGGDYIRFIGANKAGKCACSLLNCISVTDDSETNEQNKLIATDSSMHTPNLTHSYVEKCGFLTRRVNDCCIHGTEKVQITKIDFHTEKWCGNKCMQYEKKR